MTDLILQQNNGIGEYKLSTFNLWKKLNELRGKNIQHGDFLAKVEDEIDNLGVSDFFPHPQNNQPVRYYMLNKDQMLLVGMRESKVVRKKVLAWIKTLESNQQFQIPQTLGEALQLAADQAKQLELAAPKVAFVDNCVERGALMTATQVAQKHKLSAIKLNKFLDELGGVYSKAVKRGRAFLQPFVDNGLGEMKQTELGHSQALFTAKGEQWINEKLISEGVI